MAIRTSVYLVEKYTGLIDKSGVELYYTFAVRLTRSAAEGEFKSLIESGEARVRKLIATK